MFYLIEKEYRALIQPNEIADLQRFFNNTYLAGDDELTPEDDQALYLQIEQDVREEERRAAAETAANQHVSLFFRYWVVLMFLSCCSCFVFFIFLFQKCSAKRILYG